MAKNSNAAGSGEAPDEARGERLQKILSAAGVASRRKAEELILAGRVQVNGAVLADPSIITFDGYGAGWIMDLEGDAVELQTPEDYVAFLQTLPPPQCFVKE